MKPQNRAIFLGHQFLGVSAAARIIGMVEEDKVGKILVVPCFMCVATAAWKASSVPSIKSRLHLRHVISTLRGRVHTFGVYQGCPTTAKSQFVTSKIFPSLINTEPSFSQPCGVRIFPLMICVNMICVLSFAFLWIAKLRTSFKTSKLLEVIFKE